MAGNATVGILRVLLTMNSAEFDSAAKRVASVAGSLSKDFGQMGRQATALGASLTRTLTVPLLGLGVGAAKVAMDFESSFANVRKTVDASDEALDQLAVTFRNLAKEIPVTTTELNKIAAMGGQMGVPIAQLESFTRHVAALGVAVDGISAEEAAAGLAQIGNSTGQGTTKIAEMASALVHLGNKSNATESDILDFTKRLIGAGHSVGMTVPQVMALGTAMADVGINAEAGGSAMSTVIQKISVAVSKGGESLAEFAKVANMSAEAFAATFKRSPIEAIDQFIQGLSSMRERGVDLNLTMGELGTEGLRVADTLKRLSGAGDGVATSLVTANEGFAAGNKHLTEAEEKYKTTEKQLVKLWNVISEVGITLGNALLPMINLTIQAITNFIPVIDALARGFNAMPTFMQAIVVGLGLMVAAVGPLIFIFGQLLLSAQAITGAFAAKGLATRALTALMPPLTVATTAQTVATRAATIANAIWAPGLTVVTGATARLTAALGLNTLATNASAVASRMAAAAKAFFATALLGASTAASALLARLGATTAGMYASAVGARAAAIGVVGLGTALSTLLVASTVIGLLVAMTAALVEVAKATRGFWAAVKEGKGWEFITARDEDNFVRRAFGMRSAADGLRGSLEELNAERGKQITEQITGKNLSNDMALLTKQATALAAAGELTPPIMKRIAEMAGQIKSQHQELSPVLQSVVDAYSREAVASREAANAAGHQSAATTNLSQQLKAAQAAVAALTVEQRKAIVDGEALGKSAGDIADELNKQHPALGITEAAVRLYTGSLKGAGKAANETTTALIALRDALSGKETFAEAARWMTIIGEIKDLTKLTTDEQQRALSVLQAAVDKYNALKQVAPPALLATVIQLDAMNQRLKDGTSYIEQLGLTFDTVLPPPSIAETIAELERMGKIMPGFEMGETIFTPIIPGSVIDTTGVTAGIGLGAALLRGFKESLQSIPGILQQAFTGGGGLTGALKAIGVQLADSIIRPILEKMTQVGQKAAALSISIGAGLAGALGSATGGSTIGTIGSMAGLLGGLAIKATAFGGAMTAAGVSGAVALGAVTLGIGAAAVGVALLIKKFATVSKEIKAARKAAEEFQAKLHETLTAEQRMEAAGRPWAASLIVVRDAFAKIGRSAADAEAVVAALLDTDNPARVAAAMRDIAAAFEEVERRAKAANDIFDEIMEAGSEGIPDFMRAEIEQLIALGLLTDEQAEKLRGLGDSGAANFRKMQEASDLFKGRIESLGPAFRQAKIDETSKKYINAFDALIRGGADVGGALFDAREEFSELANDAKKHGTTLPANMKPWIEELFRAGLLVDENGEKLMDLAGIKYGEAIKTEAEIAKEGWDKILLKIQELIDKITGPLQQAIGDIPTDIRVRVGVDYDEGVLPPPRDDDLHPMAAASAASFPNFSPVASSALATLGASPFSTMSLPSSVSTVSASTQANNNWFVIPFPQGADPDAIIDAMFAQIGPGVAINRGNSRVELKKILVANGG